ncbi:hypothetical protein GGX14DRAFT_630563 [Mycena pura]|uniref:Mediator complex subunit 27 n=1 Tax=Mycena pura TaxID=153505 RepID=A0AAD6VH27_9AGAR|nr:hypothetical protein GGX14DRAFT_630563 [Mycena pura]
MDNGGDMEKLSSMISSLSHIHSRLQTLRNAPSLVLKSSLSFSTPSIREQFQQLKELSELIDSDSVQDALLAAANSEKVDNSDLNRNGRRDIQKRRRPPSPAESPQPYVPFDKRLASLFPTAGDGPPALRADELAVYIREFNRTHSCKLHIWTQIRGPTHLSHPAVVRLTIQDVLVCYITMAYTTDDRILITECVTAFGPREKKSPHSQSDFLVYQSLSQQIASMLQSHPRVSFQNLVNLMCSYEGIFIDRCTSCGRVLSAEGHVPPVVRIWMETGDIGHWEPRHASCPQT